MTAREVILQRIRTALADRSQPALVTRDYRGSRGPGDLELFIDRLHGYGAGVHRGLTIEAVLQLCGISRIVVPTGLCDLVIPGVELVCEPVDVAVLAEVDSVLTTCAVAVADTGTIVLDASAGMGKRELTLIPDCHVVLVRRDQIVAGVPDAIAALDPTRPLTWISGPSATSDIELERFEGVHGPRRLEVIIAE